MAVLVARALLAAVLLGSALLKLAAPRASRDALATFGVRGDRARLALWSALVAAEAALAVAVLAGSAAAAYAAALLELGFAAALVLAMSAGRAGAPCGCFGARSRVSRRGAARNLALAAGFAALPWLPAADAGTEEWLILGLAVALVAITALTVAVLALARELSELRVRLAPQAALELAGEGPELGARADLIAHFELEPGMRLALAVFTSESCPICTALAPAVDVLRRDPLVAVRAFDERRDADAWQELMVPGAPYAVALDPTGTVLAKGTANSLAQLENVLGTAERRARELVRA